MSWGGGNFAETTSTIAESIVYIRTPKPQKTVVLKAAGERKLKISAGTSNSNICNNSRPTTVKCFTILLEDVYISTDEEWEPSTDYGNGCSSNDSPMSTELESVFEQSYSDYSHLP